MRANRARESDAAQLGAHHTEPNRVREHVTGSTITAIAADAAGAAGSNPNFICADEIWGFTSERAHRLFYETLPSP